MSNSEMVKKLSSGLFSRVTDLALFSLYFSLEFVENVNSGRRHQINEKIIDDFENLNSNSIKRSIRHLKTEGLWDSKITTQGRERIKNLVPKYFLNRDWDSKIYLIVYDLPNFKNSDRNALRAFLKKVGAGPMQESVWVTPYNPEKLVSEFASTHLLDDGQIIVASLGQSGRVGDLSTKSLMEKIYNLNEINKRYEDFLNDLAVKNREQIIFGFLSILKDDPQLPFELLPNGWLGKKAFEEYKKVLDFKAKSDK